MVEMVAGMPQPISFTQVDSVRYQAPGAQDHGEVVSKATSLEAGVVYSVAQEKMGTVVSVLMEAEGAEEEGEM